MKHIMIFFILLSVKFDLCSQEATTSNELSVNNKSSHAITFQIYPVSMVFNGYNRYDLHARFPTLDSKHISGSGLNTYEFFVASNSSLVINHDNSSSNGETEACVGYGIYRFIIFCPHYQNYRDSGLIEWDGLYPYDDSTGNCDSDLNIEFHDFNSVPKIYFPPLLVFSE